MATGCTMLTHPKAHPKGELRSLPQLCLKGSRHELREYFENTWSLTEMLFEGLASEEVLYRRPYHKLRHPLIFYYAHPAVLYVNKLRVAGLLAKPLRPEFEALFETGVDEMRWDDLHEGKEVWPPLSEVIEYRREVYALIHHIIDTHPQLEPDHLPITQDSPLWALVMGFEHERIHLETSSVLMRELPAECVQKPASWPAFHHYRANTAKTPREGEDFPRNEMLPVAETTVNIGKPRDYPSFGWDNEYGTATRTPKAFRASQFLISNGEFHAFVASGGYREQRFWSPEGWSWRQFRNSKWPSFWVPDGPAGLNQFRLRTTFEVVDMQWDWPVCVNFHEAKAYAAWKSEREGKPFRLITEAEHHALRDGEGQPYNLDLSSGAECAVNALPANAKGFHDVFGNVWQWCEDHFHPLAGFRPHPYYDDFSTPCFDGEHQMILGGSFISTGDEASPFARFHFRPHFFQHAGFRLVQSDSDGDVQKILLTRRQMPYAISLFTNTDVLYREVLDVRNAVLIRPDFVGVTESVLDEDKDSIHFLGQLNNKPIGCVSLRIENGKGILRQMAVLPQFRMYGVGKNLVDVLEDHARRRGVTEIRIEARLTAEGFYRKLGYEADGEVYLLEGLEHRWMSKPI